MPAPESKPVRPLTIALVCVAVIAALFIGSIVVGVAVVEAEHANPASTSAQ